MSVTKEFDMNWSVKFEITLDGCDASFFDLDEAAQEYLCEQIREGYFHGTTGGVKLRRTGEDEQ